MGEEDGKRREETVGGGMDRGRGIEKEKLSDILRTRTSRTLRQNHKVVS